MFFKGPSSLLSKLSPSPSKVANTTVGHLFGPRRGDKVTDSSPELRINILSEST